MDDGFDFHHTSSNNQSQNKSENRRLSKEISRVSNNNNEKIDQLEAKLDKLSLITEALWEIVKETGVEESQLKSKIQQVTDLKTAKKKEKLSCTGCGMTVPAVNVKCMYCGEVLGKEVESSIF